mgnify:CR=1 FL=1|jgi:hypothetical protein
MEDDKHVMVVKLDWNHKYVLPMDKALKLIRLLDEALDIDGYDADSYKIMDRGIDCHLMLRSDLDALVGKHIVLGDTNASK